VFPKQGNARSRRDWISRAQPWRGRGAGQKRRVESCAVIAWNGRGPLARQPGQTFWAWQVESRLRRHRLWDAVGHATTTGNFATSAGLFRGGQQLDRLHLRDRGGENGE